MQCRHQVLLSIAVIYRRRRDIEALSCLAVCAYLLSSSVLTPNSKLTECRKFVADKRCRSNVLCFLPGQFVFEHGLLKFRGRLDKKYIEKHFPKAKFIDQDAIHRVSVPIGHPALEALANYFSKAPRSSRELGEPFVGDLLHRKDKTTIKYANAAVSLFDTYGLGAQGASRFFLLFWEEYMLYLRATFVQEEFQGAEEKDFSLGFEVFGYGNNLKEFGTNIVKNRFVLPNTNLSARLARILPEIELRDIGNVPNIKKKIELTSGWNKMGTRAAFLKLALRKNVSIVSLCAFRSFFLLAVELNMEFIPYNTAEKFLTSKSLKKFQRTIEHSDERNRQPIFSSTNVRYIKYVKDINEADPTIEGTNKRRREA